MSDSDLFAITLICSFASVAIIAGIFGFILGVMHCRFETWKPDEKDTGQ